VRSPPPELLAALDRAVLARLGQRQGQEVRFLCPAHDDHRPSARWNRGKGVWRCDACGVGGGAVDLAKQLGVELPAAPARTARETVYLIRDAGGLPIAEHVRHGGGEGGSGGDKSGGAGGAGTDDAAEADDEKEVFDL
jgi:hypothetical protein